MSQSHVTCSDGVTLCEVGVLDGELVGEYLVIMKDWENAVLFRSWFVPSAFQRQRAWQNRSRLVVVSGVTRPWVKQVRDVNVR